MYFAPRTTASRFSALEANGRSKLPPLTTMGTKRPSSSQQVGAGDTAIGCPHWPDAGLSHRDSRAHFPGRFLAEASPDNPSAGQFHVEAGQRFRQAFDAIKHAPALAEDLADVFVGVGIEAEAEGGNALGG